MIGSGASDPGGVRAPGFTPWWLDLLGLAWVVTAAVAVLLPALLHGASLGPYGLIYQLGLARQNAIGVRNPFGAGTVAEMIPWTWLGVIGNPIIDDFHLEPLASYYLMNWQSACRSGFPRLWLLLPMPALPTRCRSLPPGDRGAGVYVAASDSASCCSSSLHRVFEPGRLPSDARCRWLLLVWSGWILAATILVLRGRNRARSIAFFSLVLACAVYAGQPDTLVLLTFVLAVFVIDLGGSGLSARCRDQSAYPSAR